MDLFDISPIFREYKQVLSDESNRCTRYLYFLIVFSIAAGVFLITEQRQKVFEIIIVAYSILVGFSLNLYILLANKEFKISEFESEEDYEDATDTLYNLRILTLFEVILGLIIITLCLVGIFSYKALKIAAFSITGHDILFFLVLLTVTWHVSVLVQTVRSMSILTTEEYL